MQKVRIIFNTKANNIQERIRLLFGKYVSVSIIINNKKYSITPKYGVQVEPYINKSLSLDEIVCFDKHYDIIIPNAFVYSKAERFLKRQENKKFDYFGATLGQTLGLGFQSEDKWFDSELITKYLQYCLFDEVMDYNASKISINKLEKIVSDIATTQKDKKDAVIERTNISKKIQDFKSKLNNN